MYARRRRMAGRGAYANQGYACGPGPYHKPAAASMFPGGMVFPGSRRARPAHMPLRRQRLNPMVGQGQYGRPVQRDGPAAPPVQRVRNGTDVFPMYGDLPDPNLVDEGAFATFLLRVLDENNIRMLGGLTAPLRRILYVNLYNAYKGLNPHLLNQLKQADARQAAIDDGM